MNEQEKPYREISAHTLDNWGRMLRNEPAVLEVREVDRIGTIDRNVFSINSQSQIIDN